MLINALDFYIASKYVKAQTQNGPYSFDLNKKLPSTISKDSILPKNITDFPEVPDVIKPAVQAFISDLQRLEQVKERIKQEEERFRKTTLAPDIQQKNELGVSLNKQAQQIGAAVQDIDHSIDTVIATINEFFIAAQKVTVQTTQQTMDPNAQLALLKGIMQEVNHQFAHEVLAKFEDAVQKFITTNTTIEKTVRVWPIPQSKIQGIKNDVEKEKKVKILLAQLQQGLDSLLQDLHDSLIGGLSGLLTINGTLHDAIDQLRPSNITPMPMPMPNARPMAAARSNGSGK